MLGSIFGKSFNSGKCKTLLRLAISRIKLLRNKRDIQVKQMRRELAQLLQNKQELTAHIRVEHVYREQNIMAAYEIIEVFCELLVVRIPIIHSQKTCPVDLKEAVASIVFAAPRCADLPELQQISKVFAIKYGKDFVSAAVELRPDCGVNRQVIQKLSVRAPSEDVRLKLMKEIASSEGVNWDAQTFEAELLKTPQDLLNGPNQFLGATQTSVHLGINEPKPVYSKDDDILDLPEVGKGPPIDPPVYKSVNFQDEGSDNDDAGEEGSYKDAASAAKAAALAANRAALAAKAAAKMVKRGSAKTKNEFNRSKRNDPLSSSGSSTGSNGDEDESNDDDDDDDDNQQRPSNQTRHKADYFKINMDSFDEHISTDAEPHFDDYPDENYNRRLSAGQRTDKAGRLLKPSQREVHEWDRRDATDHFNSSFDDYPSSNKSNWKDKGSDSLHQNRSIFSGPPPRRPPPGLGSGVGMFDDDHESRNSRYQQDNDHSSKQSTHRLPDYDELSARFEALRSKRP